MSLAQSNIRDVTAPRTADRDRSGSRPTEEVAGPGGHGQGELEEMASRPHRPWRPPPVVQCYAAARERGKGELGLGREENEFI
jgi:hypothetical protein